MAGVKIKISIYFFLYGALATCLEWVQKARFWGISPVSSVTIVGNRTQLVKRTVPPTPYVRHSTDCTSCDFGHLRFYLRTFYNSKSIVYIASPGYGYLI
jgi:hypothetical protein